MTVQVERVTATGITKTLRGKDISIEEICKISNDLLDGEYDLRLYLPDKEKFVFELLTDRLSQQKFKDFKLNSKIWELFSKCWTTLGRNDELVTIRNKLSSRVRFNEIAVQTLTEVQKSDTLKTDIVLLKWISQGLSLVLQDSKLVVSDEQSITIISKLFQLIRLNEDKCQPVLIQEIITTANKIYRLSNTTVARYGTKNVQNFCSVCLPSILYFTNSSKATVDNPELVNLLKSIISDILFRKENISNLEANITSFIKAALEQGLDFSSVAYCFQLLISKVDIAKLEGLFTIFTTSYPDIKGGLLTKIVGMNRTLSTEFLSTLVEEEIKSQNTSNYTILTQSFERNSAVGIKYANEVFGLTLEKKSSWDINELDLLTSLLNCYVRSREIPEFEKLWRSYISKSSSDQSIVISEAFINIVSQKLITLSNVQLVRLVESSVNGFLDDTIGSSYVLIATATGLLTSTTGSKNSAITKGLVTITENLKPILLKLFTLDTKEIGNNHYYWNLVYLILCLYDLEDIHNISFETLFGKPKNSVYEIPSFYFSAFRVLEQNFEALSEKLKTKIFGKFISTGLKKYGAEKMLVARWFVLLEYSLKDDQLSEFVEKLFEKSNSGFLEEFIVNDVLHEQRKLIEYIIDSFIKKTQDPKLIDGVLPFVHSVPVYCFKKSQKESLLNILVEAFINSKSENLQEATSNTIKHLLQQPTFKSSIETDIEKCLKFISCSKTDTISESSLDIVQEIMVSHLKQGSSDQVSLKILTNFTKTLINGLASFSKAKSITDLSILKCNMCLFKAERQLSRESFTYSEVYSSLSTTCLKALNGPKLLKPSDACFLLHVLSEMNLALDLPEEPLRDIAPKLGFQYGGNVAISESLFGLVASIKSTNCSYLMALFIALHPTVNQERLVKLFGTYLDNIKEESIFFDNWKYLIHSYRQETEQAFAAYSDLFTAFINNVKKSEDSLSTVHKLVVMTLSSAMDIKDDVVSKNLSNITRFANALGALLTNKSWALVQYSIELIVAYTSKISYSLLSIDYKTRIEDTYLELNKILSNVLLIHRFRFSNRQHLLIASVLPMMELVFRRNGLGLPSDYTLPVLSFEKLLGYLCEASTKTNFIPNSSRQESNSVALTTSLSIAKANLRKSLPNLLLNYIHFYLKYPVNPSTRDAFNRSIFLIFDVLTANELTLINQSVDFQSRVIFRNIYDDYKKYGKWKEE